MSTGKLSFDVKEGAYLTGELVERCCFGNANATACPLVVLHSGNYFAHTENGTFL